MNRLEYETNGGYDEKTNKSLQFENFSLESQSLFQRESFDGFRAEFSKPITSSLQTSYSLLLGTSNIKGYSYQLGPSYQSPSKNTLILARVNDEGTVSGRFSRCFGNNIEGRISVNSSLSDENKNMSEASIDYNGKESSYSLKVAYQGIFLLNGLFSQLITNKLQLGGELTWITANNSSIMSVGSRYCHGKNIFFNQIIRQPDFSSPGKILSNIHSLRSSFYRKVSDRLSLASEVEVSIPNYESKLRFGYEYLFKTARIQGMIDTCGKISLQCLDNKGFGISGEIDYIRNDYKFGFMMHFFPNEKDDKID
ncbi:mitochondrial import receptor subunit TOM40 [Cryptosporidium ubiquitum]|uniref:Mitochondrial import receptor subunit TOM40 n=1 Tax=Cryptosporidium ubiquitum TaxID=857276 RepID=A0A1J4MKA8_9CRYT|nr:mitochondrial import receptor subunit TOM40 [Cryptosporidium ubiquitum]OII74698.1 mitochondrial import receptor subunit TOM40 [Cryptosporidium ubiquitum]